MDTPEQEWISLDEASQRLTMPVAEVAALVLAGDIDFMVKPGAGADGKVRNIDVMLLVSDVEFARHDRWTGALADLALADNRINRAALRYGKHPTRRGRGVRGRGRPRTDDTGGR